MQCKFVECLVMPFNSFRQLYVFFKPSDRILNPSLRNSRFYVAKFYFVINIEIDKRENNEQILKVEIGKKSSLKIVEEIFKVHDLL